MKLIQYSALRKGDRQSLETMLPLPFPISMYIEPINQCMLRCTYCPMSLDHYEKEAGGFRTMTLPQFEKIALDIQAGGLLKVLRFYFMGEPLLNPDLSDMIAIACRMRLSERTELTSNGILLNGRISRRLIRSGLDYLRISISSVDQSRHERLTQTRVKVNTIRDNIHRFRRIRDEMGTAKPFLYVKLLDPFDPKEKAAFLDMYRDAADEVAIEDPMNWDDYGDHDLIAATYPESVEVDGCRSYPFPKEVCPFPFYTLAITANGDVTVCCVDWNKATKVGNVFAKGLQEIWHGEKMRQLRRMHITRHRSDNPSCRNCNFLYTTPDSIDHMPEETIVALLGANDR